MKKKSIWIFVIGFLLGFLIGCGDQTESKPVKTITYTIQMEYVNDIEKYPQKYRLPEGTVFSVDSFGTTYWLVATNPSTKFKKTLEVGVKKFQVLSQE